MESLLSQYLALVGGWKVLTIFILIGVDTLLGIILAIIKKQFAWSKLADFMNTSVLMMFGGYLVMGVVAMAETSLQVSVPVALAAIDAKLFADVINKIKSLGVVVTPK